MSLPFDGAISSFFKNDITDEMRASIVGAGKNDIISPDYPYRKRMARREYEKTLNDLHLELAKLQADVWETGKRIVVLLEGRDAAGKGGTIKRVLQHLNPRSARSVALSKPSDREQGEWYFQRYVDHLPSAGEIVLFDRSWYNRAVVEPVFGFCTADQRKAFFSQLPKFEGLIVDEGIQYIKIWLNIGQGEQLRRMMERERDPLKQWKLSQIDVDGLKFWPEYTDAIGEMFKHSHTEVAPWTVIQSDDKRRARIATIQRVVSSIDYVGKNENVAMRPDTKICGGPETWHA